jgi:RimJ/RimL family protein N-acetyltransferase
LHELTHVDGVNHVALVAFEVRGGEPENGVGVARFVRDPTSPTTAELAITLADAAQGHGVARRILRALAASAAERGIETFTMIVLGDNHRVRHLLTGLGAVYQAREGDVLSLELSVRALLSPPPIAAAA